MTRMNIPKLGILQDACQVLLRGKYFEEYFDADAGRAPDGQRLMELVKHHENNQTPQ